MSKNAIVLNRGDTFLFDLTINDESAEGGRYILQNDDVLYFGIMDPHQQFEDALVKKRYTKEDCDSEGNLAIEIAPCDTLDLIPGKYYFAIKLHKQNNSEIDPIDEIITVINKTRFIVCD